MLRTPRSTRFSIVQAALTDVRERLREQMDSERVRVLRERAAEYDATVSSWDVLPPTEEERASFVRKVLDLSVEVIDVTRGEPRA